MIYYNKISFLIILISIVSFSAAVFTLHDQAYQDKMICRNAMSRTFVGIYTSLTKCIHHGIKFMKLHGDNALSYHKHVEMYYTLFYKSIEIDSVLLPDKYCKEWGRRFFVSHTNVKNCEEQLKIFFEPPTFPVITDGEDLIEEEADIYPKVKKRRAEEASSSRPTLDLNLCPSDLDGTLDLNHCPSDVDEIKIIREADVNPKEEKRRADGILRRNVLKNALYLHVIYRPDLGHVLPNPDEESRKYFHDASSHGYGYLAEIARNSKFKTGSLTHPAEFCEEQYRQNLEDINKLTRRL